MIDRRQRRSKRHLKIRKKITGTKACPRLSVFRSAKHIYAQIIDDEEGITLVAYSDLKFGRNGTKSEKAFLVGSKLAEMALQKKITKVVFDRGGYLYHGRIAKLAEGARKGGLKF